MNFSNNQPRAQWRSYWSYLLVTTGAVVGLGNVFYFPFFIAKWGGVFVLFYVLFELLISLPLLFSELMIGRRGRQNPVGSISLLSMESNATTYWRWIGWLCFFILCLTLSYYIVAVAFSAEYFITSIKAFIANNPVSLGANESGIRTNFWVLEAAFLIFLLFTMIVIVRGINRGLETISYLTVPFYFILFFLLAIYVNLNGYFFESVRYLFRIPADQTLWPVIVAALTFAFFKLNVGMGSMIVYGSYLPYNVPLRTSTLIIVLLDIVVSLLAYFIIAPAMLASSLPLQGNAFSFNNIMLIFAALPHGLLVSMLFFLGALVAAWTPSIAMAESASVTLIERFQLNRKLAALIVTLIAICVGTFLVVSYKLWPDVILFSKWTIASFTQNIASDLATPLSAFLIAIFSGWIISRSISRNELNFTEVIYKLWRFLVCIVIPICLVVLLCLIGFD